MLCEEETDGTISTTAFAKDQARLFIYFHKCQPKIAGYCVLVLQHNSSGLLVILSEGLGMPILHESHSSFTPFLSDINIGYYAQTTSPFNFLYGLTLNNHD
jgi:hypothetical protein